MHPLRAACNKWDNGFCCYWNTATAVRFCRICRRPTSPACCVSPACSSCALFGLMSGTAIGRPTMPPSCRSLPALQRCSPIAHQPLLCMAGCRQVCMISAGWLQASAMLAANVNTTRLPMASAAGPAACSWQDFACRRLPLINRLLLSSCSVGQAASLLSTRRSSCLMLTSQAACLLKAFQQRRSRCSMPALTRKQLPLSSLRHH